MVFKYFAPAAVTGLLLGAVVGVTPAAAQQAAAVTDSSFIANASSAGLLQAKLAKLAEEKGSSPAVKDFGKRMTSDYSKTNEQLAAAAKQAAFPAPVLTRQHKETLERFTRMGRGSFDKNYMAEVSKQHSEQVNLFRQESQSGKVLSLKELAAKMLPEVEQRLSLATQTAGTVGADVTASTAEEKPATSN